MANENICLPTDKDVESYALLKDMLQAQRQEFDLLTKKKADGPLNKMKIKMINRVLEPLNELLKNEPAHQFLDILNEDEMPTNSDVVLIIGQYEKALKVFKNRYFLFDKDYRNKFGRIQERWNTREKPIKRIGNYDD